MMIEDTFINDLKIISFDIFKDNRGFFTELYNQKRFIDFDLPIRWMQDNFSYSRKNVIRGLHYQKNPYAQIKLITCLKGSILDVAVDIRGNSPTFGQYFSIELNESNGKSLLVPAGFAHGFSALAEEVCVLYKVNNLYDKGSEGSINPLDKALNIDWCIDVEKSIISEKDSNAMSFEDYKSNCCF